MVTLTLKMVFTASLLGAQLKINGIEKKPSKLASRVVEEALDMISTSLCGKLVVGPSILSVAVTH